MATPSSRTESEVAQSRPDASQKRLILTAAILGTTVVTVDSTVVNVALPAIADDLGGGLAGQQWTANAYLVTLSSLILIGGSLGDLFGERRMFMTGVAGFGVTSVFCALAPTIELLVVARALQGVFGALLTPAALAVIVATFPPAERGRAVGAWTAWGGIGTVLGPLIGGQLVDAWVESGDFAPALPPGAGSSPSTSRSSSSRWCSSRGSWRRAGRGPRMRAWTTSAPRCARWGSPGSPTA